MARTELPNGVILPAEYSDDWYEDMTSNLTKLDDVIGSDSEKLNADGVYFLRMSSAALTDSGTGNFSDLNSSYKIKTGDLVLDSGRKLYQVVSVDSTNETFTVGNSLFKVTAESDLAPVAESGDYDDLDNKPALKPVATSGDYDDLTDLPTYGITRFCSSAITDNSTVAFSAISSTDKIKVGDFLLDSNGKMYLIASVDTVNETVSVTTPLTQLAVDSDVVHKSGNETVAGYKVFENICLSNSIKAINLENQTIDLNNCYSSFGLPQSGNISFYFCNTNDGTANISNLPEQRAFFLISQSIRILSSGSVVYAKQTLVSSNGKTFVRYCNNSVWDSWQNVTNLVTTDTNQTISGNKTFSSINGVEPSSLSLPSGDTSNVIDISSYFTNTGSGDTNSYTASANGWIYLYVTACKTLTAYVQNATDTIYADYRERTTDGQIRIVLPIQKNNKFTSHWTTSTTVSISRAVFIPCQGNV